MSDRQFNILLQAIAAISDKLEDAILRLDEHTVLHKQHTVTLNQHTILLNEHTVILNEHTNTLNQHTSILVSIPQTTSDLINDLGKNHNKRITKIEKGLKLQAIA